MNERKDYPSGDGRPDCPECHGRGVVPLPKEFRPKNAIGPITQICRCVLARDIRANIERGWRGLSKAAPIGKSPLKGREADNLLITATAKDIKEHLRHVAARKGPRWGFQVTSDAAMMDAWLSKGLAKVWDADVEEARASDARKPAAEKSPYEALSELAEPAELLVVILGVKAARNSAMPEVLLEALTLRDFAGRPTWLVDQPASPFREGHLSWSPSIDSWAETWDRVVLSRGAVVVPASAPVVPPGIPRTFSMTSAETPDPKPDADDGESRPAGDWVEEQWRKEQDKEREKAKKARKKKGKGEGAVG